jgi:two-component system, NtrC family, nitrogen regulation sensor histidine kinase NtrY
LRKTKLGRKSEPIVWKQKDEIGALINEYNRMLNEIQLSAEILAKSERESAWREMAKQVAHEIKNPLTPMKLGVQHLQRAWNDNHPDKDKIIDRISQSLIEQINTLSNIANEFSNFAKLPKADLQNVDLAHIISSVVDLYSETEEVDLQFDRTRSNLIVLGDNDQLIRVFSNLIKNAIQAIPEGRTGIVSIDINEENKQYVVNVKDNGKGISADEMNKIFVPNFTTKSSGMGLGLAMVKNMIDGMNGTISFESKVDKGTIFTIKLAKLL